MYPTNPEDEYLHEPADVRLWNESFYFGFSGDDLAVATRLGFQPYEGRANIWFYIHDLVKRRTYFHRDEEIPLTNVHGLHADTGPLSLLLRVVEPNTEWSLTADGYCDAADSVRGVFEKTGTGIDGEIPVEMELSFRKRKHEAYTERRSERKQKTTQPGHFEGQITVDDTKYRIDAPGFRDHSWGGQRNWTPVSGGYFWYTLRVSDHHAFKIAGYVNPEEQLTIEPIGFHSDGTTLRETRDATLEYGDGLTPDTRLDAWLGGKLPSEFFVDLTFEDGDEQLVLEPRFNNPLGYEDRNWATADLESPWLTSVVHRLPVDVRWDGQEGSGWFETMHPRIRVDTQDLGSEGI